MTNICDYIVYGVGMSSKSPMVHEYSLDIEQIARMFSTEMKRTCDMLISTLSNYEKVPTHQIVSVYNKFLVTQLKPWLLRELNKYDSTEVTDIITNFDEDTLHTALKSFELNPDDYSFNWKGDLLDKNTRLNRKRTALKNKIFEYPRKSESNNIFRDFVPDYSHMNPEIKRINTALESHGRKASQRVSTYGKVSEDTLTKYQDEYDTFRNKTQHQAIPDGIFEIFKIGTEFRVLHQYIHRAAANRYSEIIGCPDYFMVYKIVDIVQYTDGKLYFTIKSKMTCNTTHDRRVEITYDIPIDTIYRLYADGKLKVTSTGWTPGLFGWGGGKKRRTKRDKKRNKRRRTRHRNTK
jgi:hypothetical protein